MVETRSSIILETKYSRCQCPLNTNNKSHRYKRKNDNLNSVIVTIGPDNPNQ